MMLSVRSAEQKSIVQSAWLRVTSIGDAQQYEVKGTGLEGVEVLSALRLT